MVSLSPYQMLPLNASRSLAVERSDQHDVADLSQGIKVHFR